MKKLKKISALLLFCLLIGVMALPVSAAAPKLNKKTASVYIGKTVKLKVSNKIGKAVITAKTGSKTLKCTVTVKKALTVNKSAVTIKGVGNTAKVKVNFLPAKGTVTFHIADTDIVSGSWGKDEGFPDYITLTAEEAGTTTVTIDSNYNNEKYTVKVTVKDTAASSKTPFETLGAQIKSLNVKNDDGAYIIGRDLSTSRSKIYLIVEYYEAAGKIVFNLAGQTSSTYTVQTLTIYKYTDACEVYIGVANSSGGLEYEVNTTRSAIRENGYLYFHYKGTTSYPSSSMQSSLNDLNNSFMTFCDNTIPRTYAGKAITVSMKDLFPNF